MELHLIRHGQTNWNKERRAQGQSESELTELGVQQAKALGDRIAQLDFDQIYCSSSLRTRQTAEHVFGSSNIQYLDSLREIYLGPWEGRLYDDIANQEPDSHQHFWQQPHLFKVTGAETLFQLQDRAVTTVAEIAADFEQKKVALISHGALIKSFLCHATDTPIKNLWSPPSMHNCAHSIIELNYTNIDLKDKHRGYQAKIVQYADQMINGKQA